MDRETVRDRDRERERERERKEKHCMDDGKENDGSRSLARSPGLYGHHRLRLRVHALSLDIRVFCGTSHLGHLPAMLWPRRGTTGRNSHRGRRRELYAILIHRVGSRGCARGSHVLPWDRRHGLWHWSHAMELAR
jgi:hypothetical protein